MITKHTKEAMESRCMEIPNPSPKAPTTLKLWGIASVSRSWAHSIHCPSKSLRRGRGGPSFQECYGRVESEVRLGDLEWYVRRQFVMSWPVQWKTVRYWSREYENFGLYSLKVFGLGLVKQIVYILVHLLKDSQISRMQSTTNFDFIIFHNMTLFLIKHLYILSIHKGSSMKACIQPLLSACAPLRALSILSHPAAISHASNPLPTRNLLAICTERNWWWKPHVLISLPAFVSRCCVVWRPHSEPDCRRWGWQSGLLRHRCFRRRLRLVFGKVWQAISLDELNHYVLGLEEEIFRRKSVYANICKESRNILLLEVLQIAMGF